MGLSICKLSSISSNKSVSGSNYKWAFCVLEIVACNWEIYKDRLLRMGPLKCLDNWYQVYELWLYLWGMTQNEEILLSHLRWICNFKFCTSSPGRTAFSKSINHSLISWSMWVWFPQAELAFWRHCCSNVVVCIVSCSASPATAAVVAIAIIPTIAAIKSPISLLEHCSTFFITFKKTCVSGESSQGLNWLTGSHIPKLLLNITNEWLEL